MRVSTTPGLIAVASLILSAATPTATLEWPFGRVSELASPDGNHIVYGEPYQKGVREGPELWLRHRGRSERKRLLQLGATARAFWWPDSRHFVIVDRGSDRMTSSIYDTEGRVVVEIRPENSDADLRRVATGHYYVEAQQFLDSDRIRVAAYGHTDTPPVRCFRFIYSVTLSGKIDRLSKRISPVTATGCDERSE